MATRVTLVCFWKLKFYRNRKKMHVYMNENVFLPPELIFNTAVFKGFSHLSFEPETEATKSV